MKKTIQNILKIILPIGLGVFLIWISLSKLTSEDFDDIKTSFRTANYWWIALSLFLGILSHFSRAYRWMFMLEPLGYKPKFLNSVMTVMITYLVNLGIPRAGEVSRAVAISKYENIPFQEAFGTIVAERVIDIIMLLLLIFLALFAQYDFLSELLVQRVPKDPTKAFFILGFIVVIGIVFLKMIRTSKGVFFVKVRDFLEGIFHGIKSVVNMKKKWPFIFHTFAIWILYLLMLYTATFAIPETVGLSFSAILICFVVGALSFALTNGGVGSYPLGIQQVLLLYAIASNPALSFGWIVWTSQTLMVVIFGGLSFLALPIYNKKRVLKH